MCTESALQVIDSNTYVGSWPTRRLRTSTARGLSRLSEEHGVDLCLASSLDAVFHRNHLDANRRLIEELDGHRERLDPLPIANPLSPQGNRVEGGLFRIVPPYHRYSPTNPRCLRLLKDSEAEGATVFISFRMRDRRLTHPSSGPNGPAPTALWPPSPAPPG
jgi:hypothetical protein